ncbi:MAG: serine/threonine protein kinase, partial [Gemmataceae bacterium]|nr:serine/threonine protein kinase [Gemmataceae bacterium]
TPVSDSRIHLPGQADHSTLSESGREYWHSVARIGIQVAEALAYATSQGILHRDIKPSNLLLDTQATVWITDFGLDKVADSADLTNPGDLVGTFRYLAPERFQGQADVRSDVYSLGLTLYELLTFQPAFKASDRNQLIDQVLHEEPPRPRKLNPEVPRDLETIVQKAMAKDPAHRYQTPTELAADLKRFVEDRPIRARQVALRERFWRWCRRNPVVASLTAALTILLAAVAVGATATAVHFGRMAETEKDLRIEAQHAREAAEESDQQSRHSLREMFTSYGLVAAERNDPGQGVLWFAHAARLAGPGTEQEQVNQARVTTWGRQALQPVRALPHAAEWIQSLAFHPEGRYLLTQALPLRSSRPWTEDSPSGGECTLWDLVQETPIAWPAGPRTASSAA